MAMYISTPDDICYNNYEKIADDITPIGTSAVLRINVKLSRTAQDGTRIPFHQEFAFKDSNNRTSVSIRRSFDYYLTLEMIKQNETGSRESIMITQSDFLGFKNLMEGALRWFSDETYKDLYMYNNKELVMTGHPDPLTMTVFAASKWIRVEPVIINKYNSIEPGVCISINSDLNFSNMDIKNIMAVVSFLSTYNMFQSAQEMLSYFKKPKEPKIMDFREQDFNRGPGKPGRFIGSNKSKGE